MNTLPGITPYERKIIGQLKKAIYNGLQHEKGTYLNWCDVNEVLFECIKTRSDMWQIINRIKPNTQRGYHVRRYALHVELFELIDKYLYSSGLHHQKRLRGELILKVKDDNGNYLPFVPMDFTHELVPEGEELLSTIREFSDGEAKPKKATIRFLDKCTLLIEQIIKESPTTGCTVVR